MTITPARRRKCGLRGSEDGATAVEAALVLSAFLVTLLVIIDFAQAFFIWNTLQLVVGQVSRYVIVQNIVQNGIPISSCDTTCAETALQTAISRWLGVSSASICSTPTAGQYCVNAICNPSSCSSTTSTPTMTLFAQYGFKFIGLDTLTGQFIGTYTLAGQITVPINLPPD
jgi:Flp pilus assembly protein TadG